MAITKDYRRLLAKAVVLATLAVICFSAPSYSETFSVQLQPGWRMVSIPAEPSTPINACDTFGADRTYKVEGQTFTNCDSSILLSPGTGVLVYIESARALSIEGTSLSPGTPAKVHLTPGWNEIGTPANYSISAEKSLYVDGVPMSASLAVRPMLYGYDPDRKTYYETFYMYPWEAYLIYSFRSAELTIMPVAGEGAPGPAVSIDIMNGPGSGASRVSSVDIKAGDSVTLWAAAFDARNRFAGNVPVKWNVAGSITAPSQDSDHFDIAPSPGAAGVISAVSGAITSSPVDVVAIGSGDLFAYPFNDSTAIETDPVSGASYVKNQILVSFVDGVSESEARALVESGGGSIVGRNASAGAYQVKIPEGATTNSYLSSLSGSGRVRSGSPNYIFKASGYPSDPVFASGAPADRKWHLDRIGMETARGSFDETTSPLVAVIDSGIDKTHPELSAKISGGVNMLEPSNPLDLSDSSGHGTSVAGIIAAESDNGMGGAGICGACRIMPIKVCDGAGRCPMFQVAAAISYAASNGANIINLSLGANLPSAASGNILSIAIDDAVSRGALVVASAGNNNSSADTFAPASLDGVFAVGSTDINAARSTSSNYGAAVDISAPGESIYTTLPSSDFGFVSGTSFSAAIASGAAGHIISSGKNFRAGDVASILQNAARAIQTDFPIGGLLNLDGAARLVVSANSAPVISTLTIPGSTAVSGQTISISASVVDPDGDDVTYLWSVDGGTITGAGNTAGWTLPTENGIYYATLTATDPLGASTSKSAGILVLGGALVKISVTPSLKVVKTGETIQLAAYCLDETSAAAGLGGVECPVSWSSDLSAGAITSDGIFMAASKGVAIVAASFDGVKGTALIYVEGGPGDSLYTVAGSTPCGNNWLMPYCNEASTGVSTLKLTPPLSLKTLVSLEPIRSGIVAQNGIMYFSTESGLLYAMSQTTFTTLPGWPVNLRKNAVSTFQESTPIIDPTGSYLYITSLEGYVYKVNINAPSPVVWEWHPDLTNTTYYYQNTPALDGNMIYTAVNVWKGGILQGEIFGISDNGNSATKIWSYPPSGTTISTNVFANPGFTTIDGVKMVFVPNSGGKLIALNALNGSLIYEKTVSTTDCAVTPAINGNFIYMGCGLGLYKYDLTTGTEVWKALIGNVKNHPTFYNNVLYVGVNAGPASHKIYAIRDNGATYTQLWSVPSVGGVRGPFAHFTVYAGGGVNGGGLTTEDGLAYTSINQGGFNLVALDDGASLGAFNTDNSMGSANIALNGSDVIAIVPNFDGLSVYEKNFAPEIISVDLRERPVDGAAMVAGGGVSATATVRVSDKNGLADIVSVVVDLTPFNGSATTNLNATSLNSAYYTTSPGGVITVQIIPPEGVPAGPNTLNFTVKDTAGFTDTVGATLDIGDSPPSIISTSFSRDLYNDGIDSVTVNVTVKDANIEDGIVNTSPVVRVDLDPIKDNNGVPDWITLSCGAGYVSSGQKMDCSSSAVISRNGLTPATYNLTVEAKDTINTVTTTSALKVIGVSSFSLSAAPNNPDTGAATTITITASNKYGPIANYNNAAPLTITMANGTASKMTFAGAGLTDNGNGTATIATGRFTGGSYSFTVTDTKAESNVTFKAIDVFNAQGTSNAVQWAPRTLGALNVSWTPVEIVKGQNATINIAAMDPYGNAFTTFQNPNGLTISHKSGATSAAGLIYSHSTAGIITDNLNGTADFVAGGAGFANGAASFTVTNINSDPAVVFTVAEKTSAIKGDSNSVEWLAGILGSFTLEQTFPVPPGTPITGATATIKITAYDNSQPPATPAVLVTYNNKKDITITKSGGTGSAIAWSGTGIVDNNDGTATLLGSDNGGGVFVNGVAEIKVSDTKVETPTFTIKEFDRTPNISKSIPVTWVVGPIASFLISLGVANPSMTVGDTANLTITAKDAFGNTCTNYTNSMGVTLSQSMGAAGTGIVWSGTGVQKSGLSNPPSYGDLIVGNTAAFNQGVASVGIKNTMVSSNVIATVIDIATSKTGSSVPLEWKNGALGSFVVSASPTSLMTGATSTVTITAYDVFGNLKTDFNSNTTLATTNGTAAKITWSGTNVVPLTAGTARLNGAAFNSGVATAIVADTKAEGPVTLSANNGTVTATSLAAVSPTWTPGPLASITVRTASNNGGTTVPATNMKSSDTKTVWAAGYDQYSNYINDINSEWVSTGTLDSQTGSNSKSFSFTPTTVQTSGTLKATQTGGTISGETGIISVLSAEPKPPVLTATAGENQNNLSWTAPTLSIDNIPINSAELYYSLYRSTTQGGPFVDPPLTTTAAGVTSYIDTTAQRWTTYYYKVKAINQVSGYSSDFSNEASAAPVAPQYSVVQRCGVQDPNVYHPPDYPGYLNRPGDLDIDNGKVFVADTDNHRISVFQESDCGFLYTISSYGLVGGKLRLPTGVRVFSGNVYAVDSSDRLEKFSVAGASLGSYSTLTSPVMITDDGTSLYVTSNINKALKVNASTGVVSTTESFVVTNPVGIVYNPGNGLFYVSDSVNSVVRIFNAAGVQQGTIGTPGSDYGQLNGPRGLAVNAAGNILVADTGNHRIQVFDTSGNLVNVIGGLGYTENTLRNPYSVTVSPTTGHVWIADTMNQRISEFEYTGPPGF